MQRTPADALECLEVALAERLIGDGLLKRGVQLQFARGITLDRVSIQTHQSGSLGVEQGLELDQDGTGAVLSFRAAPTDTASDDTASDDTASDDTASDDTAGYGRIFSSRVPQRHSA